MAHAEELLARYGEEARPQVVVDIGRLPGLNVIQEGDSVLRFGALTRHVQAALH